MFMITSQVAIDSLRKKMNLKHTSDIKSSNSFILWWLQVGQSFSPVQ